MYCVTVPNATNVWLVRRRRAALRLARRVGVCGFRVETGTSPGFGILVDAWYPDEIDDDCPDFLDDGWLGWEKEPE